MPFVDPALVALSISAVTNLVLLPALLKSRDLKTQSILLLVIYTLLSLGWFVVEALIRLQSVHLTAAFDLFTLHRISIYLILALAAIFYQLTRRFERKTSGRIEAWVASGLALATVLLLYENPLRLPEQIPVTPGMFLLRTPAAFVILVCAWAVLAGASGLLSWRNTIGKASPLHRNRSLYWTAATFLVIASQIFVLFRLPLPGSLLHSLGLILGCYAQLNHNLPDLRSAMRRGTGNLIVTLLAAGLYTGGFLLALDLIRRFPSVPIALAGAVLALLMAALAIPFLNVLKKNIHRVMVGAGYDPSQMISEYSQAISNIIDLKYLAAVALAKIIETMEIEKAALFTVHFDLDCEEAGSYFIQPVHNGAETSPVFRLSGQSPLAAALSRDHYPLAQYDIDLLPRFQSITPPERAWLARQNLDVYIPVYSNGNWIGLLAVGPKRSGDRYFKDDLVMLQTLADQTAIALENARLYADLKQRNAENERLNRELRVANAELARLDVAKSDFINIASHELRTPLTQVMGYNDILKELLRNGQTIDPAQAAPMVDGVRKAARRLEDIVGMMFDISRLESGTLELSRAPVTMAFLVNAGLEPWMKGIEDRGQAVSIFGLTTLPPIIADSRRMIQVFSNLIQNAVKSTPDGGHIRIIGQMVPAEPAAENQASLSPAWIEVIISDTGIGIDPQDLERIFAKFYRVGNVLFHSTGDTKFKGAGPGLGLTIARGIVEAHGGKIWAESPGYDERTCPGASFHVMLPAPELKDL